MAFRNEPFALPDDADDRELARIMERNRPRIVRTGQRGNLLNLSDDASAASAEIARARLKVAFARNIYRWTVPEALQEAYVRALLDHILTAIELSTLLGPIYDLHVPSIRPPEGGGDFTREQGIGVLVDRYARSLERLGGIDPDAAKAQVALWPEETDSVFARLKAWVIGEIALTTPEQASQRLRELDRKAFWKSHNARDLLISLRQRWSDLPAEARHRAEAMLLEGPALRDEDEEGRLYRARSQLLAVAHLQEYGVEFDTFNPDAQKAEWQKTDTDWDPEYWLNADRSMDGRSGYVRVESDASGLAGLPVDRIVAEAREKSGRTDDFFTEKNPFRGFCETKPGLALNALLAANSAGDSADTFWSMFLNRRSEVAQSEDEGDCRDPALDDRILDALTAMDTDMLAKIEWSALRWLETNQAALIARRAADRDLLFERFVDLLAARNASDAPGFNAHDVDPLNSLPGRITDVAYHDPRLRKEHGDKDVPVGHLLALLALPSPALAHVLGHCAMHMPWLNHLDTRLTDSILEGLRHDGTEAAFWAGYRFTRRLPAPPLFARLKPLMQRHVETATDEPDMQSLAATLFNRWLDADDTDPDGSVTDQELSYAIRQGPERFRVQLLDIVRDWSMRDTPTAAEVLAATERLLRDIWPLQRAYQTEKTTDAIASLVTQSVAHFDALSEFAQDRMRRDYVGSNHLSMVYDEDDPLIAERPVPFLDFLDAVTPSRREDWASQLYNLKTLLDRMRDRNPEVARRPAFGRLSSLLRP